jgi:hypothetical protein
MGFPPVIEWEQMDDMEPCSRVLTHDEPIQPRPAKIVRYIRHTISARRAPSCDPNRRLMLSNLHSAFRGLVVYNDTTRDGAHDLYYAYLEDYRDPGELFEVAEKATDRGERL